MKGKFTPPKKGPKRDPVRKAPSTKWERGIPVPAKSKGKT
jgi:hypothetical protein